MQPIKKEITRILWETLKKYPIEITAAEAEASLQAPKEDKFGDLSTHLVLKLAKEMKEPPRPLAEALSKELWQAAQNSPLKERLEKIAVEGPGFLNFYYSLKEVTDVLSRIALGRIGEPMEVAGAVVFLASPAAALITGDTLLIDGGWTAR